jgi:hypothetical protein
MKLLPILALLLTALPTFARLGETKAECEKRYGKPFKTLEDGIDIFKKAGLDITVIYLKDTAARISFSKANPEASPFKLDQSLPLSEAERDTLLKANSGGSPWKEDLEAGADYLRWKRADKKAAAMYSPDSKVLTIYTSDYADHLDEEEKKQETKKLDGF